MKYLLLVFLSSLIFGQAVNLSPAKPDAAAGEVVKEDLGQQIDTYFASLESKGFSGAAFLGASLKTIHELTRITRTNTKQGDQNQRKVRVE